MIHRSNLFVTCACIMAMATFTGMQHQPVFSSSDAVALSDGKLSVRLSSTTGQVVSLADARGATYLTRGEDRYDLDGKASTESGDSVVVRKVGRDRVVFQCVNQSLGLKLEKRYRLKDNVLSKEVNYARGDGEKLLLKVSSQSVIDSALYRDGYYYVPTDDGYKVYTSPFTAGASVKEPVPWTVSTGSFVFYFPKQDRVLTHYRYKVNGQYFYSEAHPLIESKFIPGGAVTAIGAGFIDNRNSLTLESRYALIDGDSRDYHKHVISQPPYTQYETRKAPQWFNKTRMFLSDVGASGMSLMKNREAVAKDVMSFLKLLTDDEDLMVFFNHWSTTGDFPYKGTFRYYTYSESGYSEPAPVEKLKENIRWLKSLSPRIKVGGYAMFVPTAGTYPYDAHKDWLVYNKEGMIDFASDGIGLCGMPDFASGYREYLLDQMKHYVTDLGFDWIHVDCGPFEAINWKTKDVVQGYETAKFYDELGTIFESNHAAIVENVAPMVALWAHGGYVECQQPDRWEKRDWRILAIPGYLAALYRTHRPNVWTNLCYGTKGIYGIRNAQTGMRGWIRNALTWWRDVAHSLAHEKVIDELLETKVSDIHVSPSWWKLQTDKLETEALQRGQAFIIPVLLHGDKASEEPSNPAGFALSIPYSELRVAKSNYLFTFDLQLSPPDSLDVFKPVPWKSDYMELMSFNPQEVRGDTYRHRMKLEPLRNYYHLLTQTPAWVYTWNGERTSLLLPENRNVRITGALPIGANGYRLHVENGNRVAQVLAYLPETWNGVNVKVNGNPVNPARLQVLNARCVLVDVAEGKSEITLTNSKSAELAKLREISYINPFEEVWRETAARVFYCGLDHRAYEEEGKSCLALKETTPGNGGSAEFLMVSKEKASGFSLKVKGENTGHATRMSGKIIVALSAGDTWTYEIRDDSNSATQRVAASSQAGWKEFTVNRDQMTPGTTRKKWDVTTCMTLRVYPANGKEMNIADLRLLPAKEGDFTAQKQIKRRLVIHRTKTPPVIDGYGNDPCWKNCEVVTDFYKYGANDLSESKTLVRMCYDDNNLYILFDNQEPITKLEEKRVPELQVFTSDHAHLFIDPFKDVVHYYEIGVDTAGTVADIKNSETGWDVKWNGEYEVKTGLNWNVGWLMEMRIPFKTLGKFPKTGEVWGITFARIDIAKEFSVWTNGEWNDPSAFGELVFGGEGK